jgi:branched-chain amino acid transport system ATP-binding protein
MLNVRDLVVDRGDVEILHGMSLGIAEGDLLCILGPNGAGKSTLLNTVSGHLRARSGTIEFLGERIDGRAPHEIVARGLIHVLERRRLFSSMTVWENLDLGAYPKRAKAKKASTLEWVYELFPVLESRARQLAYSLSGGEQQMLAIGRGVMGCPRLLLLDEPFLGLTPAMMTKVAEAMTRINQAGITVAFVEQNPQEALRAARRGCVLESGSLVLDDRSDAVLQNELVREVYLGVR